MRNNYKKLLDAFEIGPLPRLIAHSNKRSIILAERCSYYQPVLALKMSESLKVFWRLQEAKKWNIGLKWIKKELDIAAFE